MHACESRIFFNQLRIPASVFPMKNTKKAAVAFVIRVTKENDAKPVSNLCCNANFMILI